MRPSLSSIGSCTSAFEGLLSGRTIGIALDFLLGFEIPRWLRSMSPNIRGPSLPDVALPTEAEKFIGVNAGASGLNDGPEEEKLKSLWPGVNAGAPALTLLPLLIDLLLKWLLIADIGGAKDGKAVIDWLFGVKLNWLGLKVLVGSNLNSFAATLSFEADAFCE
jgi:hypothetical protein